MKWAAGVIIAVILVFTNSAFAHTKHHYRNYYHHVYHARNMAEGIGFDLKHMMDSARSNVAAARSRGLPWCGAEMADEYGFHGALGRRLWVARAWASVGRATTAHIGAVVVWAHHVGRIVGRINGEWVIHSGNDGHRVRDRARSISGAIAIRDVGGGSNLILANFNEEPHHHYRTRKAKVVASLETQFLPIGLWYDQYNNRSLYH